MAVPFEGDKIERPRMGRYQLVRRLPGGGMTEVYLGRVAGTVGPERLLVLKALPRSHGQGEAAEARFLEEAVISLSLAHGNITTTFEAGRGDDGTPFLVMEYVHGSSLRELLGSGPLPPHLATMVAREIARALRYTHTFTDIEGRTSPMVHLDVTPENVLVSMAGHVKLTDFGIARAVGQAAGGTVFGKAAYTAPEILARGDGGPAADIWSLGCVLYEMLSGDAPHRGSSREETIARVREGKKPPPPSKLVELPRAALEDLDGLLSALLEPEPSDRLADATKVERILSGVLNRVEPMPTEADLASLMAVRFPARGEHRNRHRLRAELEDAGCSLTGSETTSELLEEGTVPLAGETSGAPQDEASTPRSDVAASTGSSRSFRASLFVMVAVLLVGVAVAATLGGGEDAPGYDVVQAEAAREKRPLSAEQSHSTARDAVEAAGEEPVSSPEANGDDGGGEAPVKRAPSASRAPVAAPGLAEGEEKAALPEPRREESRDVAGRREEPIVDDDSAESRPEISVARVKSAQASVDGPTAPSEEDRADGTLAEGAARGDGSKTEPLEDALLQINAYPYARVVLDDDRELGTTPLRDVAVPAGTRRLVFTNPELGLRREVSLELESGEERVVGVRLDR